MVLVAALIAWPFLATGAPDDGLDVAADVTPAAQRAVSRGLEYLTAHQGPRGAWDDIIGRKVNNLYLGHHDEHVGVTAIACMAYMAGGSVPGEGIYGAQVERGVDFVLRCVKEDGFVTHSESRMYSHGFATLMLAEAYGMTGREDIRDKLRLAAGLIVRSQNAMGGWRYLPGAQDSDISIVVTQVQALRAARNVGVYVPYENIRRAIQYVRDSFITSDRSRRNGFWYQIFPDQPYRPSRTSFALTAAGVTALFGAGEYDSPEILGGLSYMMDVRNRPPAHHMNETFDYFYGNYYAIQAMFQAGGTYWESFWPRLRDEIVAGQQGDGRWEDLVGANYATAMACLILQIPYRYLPIFDR
jgi:hypothetical protein